jgi:hypothetical protein
MNIAKTRDSIHLLTSNSGVPLYHKNNAASLLCEGACITHNTGINYL